MAEYNFIWKNPPQVVTEAFPSLPKRKVEPICGIYAAAQVSGKTVDEVFQDYKKTFKMRDNWKGKTKLFQVLELLDKYGVKYKEIKVSRQRLKSLVEDVSHIKKTMLVRTTRHIQLLRGEFVEDQQGNKHIDQYWGKNKIVDTVIIVENL